MRVIVVGLKGCGKTTVLKMVSKKRPDIKILNAGDYFEKVFNRHGFGRDTGQLAISKQDYLKHHQEIFQEMGKDMKNHKNVIVDTHLFIHKPEGFYPGLPIFALSSINPDVIAILDYPAESILKRRMKDEREIKRKRVAERTIEGVKMEQEVQEHYGFVASGVVGCTLKIIRQTKKEKHPFEHAEKSAEEILKLFSQ